MASDRVSADRHLPVISYNMRGFNLGRHVVRDLITADLPDVMLLQEHLMKSSPSFHVLARLQ